ncbi:uncharacterized protein LOC143301833 [Babylonia areolata]|uniref:uncharacterized protein LOC143301833 n=1 Tax=Babylonia areolata TaxID=304850 RepID=UPI003FD259BD
MAAVATSTPKRHGFSIESLIGRRDDSPRRQPLALLPRPEDFSTPRDLVCKDSALDGSGPRDRIRDSIRVDSSRDSLRDGHRDHYVRDSHHHLPGVDSVRDMQQHATDGLRDSFRESSRRDSPRESPIRSRSRQGTLSPSSPPPAAHEDRVGRRSSSPPSPSLVSPRMDKTLPPSSPGEAENRVSGWSSEDFKHLLSTGAFHQQGGHPMAASAVEGSSLYQPLRVCNRSLSAAMNSAAALLPHHFAGLPLNPLLYNLHRDLAPHPTAHPLLAARYPGFVHPRYPLGPPPGLLFHPYRKPKRNRTAFSPSQLLQLEQAFEKNHYVVGQERKTLASKLQLTETQVKVWFQNRRTKHKRMKAEEEASGGVTSGDEAGKVTNSSDGPGDVKSDASDHELLEDDVCSSDEEELSVTEDS